jgi:hypothetical protein
MLTKFNETDKDPGKLRLEEFLRCSNRNCRGVETLQSATWQAAFSYINDDYLLTHNKHVARCVASNGTFEKEWAVVAHVGRRLPLGQYPGPHD